MKILAVDTSCDDTCIAILKTEKSKSKLPEFKILSNIISSQIKIHQKYGGVVPVLAKREHQKNLVPLLKRVLRKINGLEKKNNSKKNNSKKNNSKKNNSKKNNNSRDKKLESFLKREGELYKKVKIFLEKYKKPQIDFIAVTQGPGLEPALWSGVNFARALSYFWQKPLVSVNHIEAHILANFIGKSRIWYPLFRIFPAICLVASGGHTELILMRNIGNYKLLGETRDDAAGECLDKVAKLLNLSYPGGPKIEKLAKKGGDFFSLPRPMINSKNYDFSFAGLKTAVLYLTRKIKKGKLKNLKVKRNLSASTQQSIIDVLIFKTLRAARKYKVKTILLGGGVVANKELQKQFKEILKKKYPIINIYYPPDIFCTDNAAMVGVSGYFNFLGKKIGTATRIGAKPNLKI